MSITSEQELEARIHSFLDRKLERFPEIARMESVQERSSLTVKVQASMSGLFRTPKRAH